MNVEDGEQVIGYDIIFFDSLDHCHSVKPWIINFSFDSGKETPFFSHAGNVGVGFKSYLIPSIFQYLSLRNPVLFLT